jgi:hypothetical protein
MIIIDGGSIILMIENLLYISLVIDVTSNYEYCVDDD